MILRRPSSAFHIVDLGTADVGLGNFRHQSAGDRIGNMVLDELKFFDDRLRACIRDEVGVDNIMGSSDYHTPTACGRIRKSRLRPFQRCAGSG
jgi:hypothetical protein